LQAELDPIFAQGGEDTYHFTRSNWSKNKKALILSQKQAFLTLAFYTQKFPHKIQFIQQLRQKIENPSLETSSVVIIEEKENIDDSGFVIQDDTTESNGISALGRKRKKSSKFLDSTPSSAEKKVK
jgi:hypothetical protein